MTPQVRENTALVILLDANFYADVSGVRDALKLEALDCAAHTRACQVSPAPVSAGMRSDTPPRQGSAPPARACWAIQGLSKGLDGLEHLLLADLTPILPEGSRAWSRRA